MMQVFISSSDIFSLEINLKILPHDAIFIEEVITIGMKTLHKLANKNQALQQEKTAKMKEACLEFWNTEVARCSETIT